MDEFDKSSWGMAGHFSTHTKVYGVNFSVSADEVIGSEINGCIPQGIKHRNVYAICTDTTVSQVLEPVQLSGLSCDGMSEDGKYLVLDYNQESGDLIFDIQKPLGHNLPAFVSEKTYQLSVDKATQVRDLMTVKGSILGIMFAGGGKADYSLQVPTSSEGDSILKLNFNGWTSQSSEEYKLSCHYR